MPYIAEISRAELKFALRFCMGFLRFSGISPIFIVYLEPLSNVGRDITPFCYKNATFCHKMGKNVFFNYQ
jgi:hypothetical protein